MREDRRKGSCLGSHDKSTVSSRKDCKYVYSKFHDLSIFIEQTDRINQDVITTASDAQQHLRPAMLVEHLDLLQLAREFLSQQRSASRHFLCMLHVNGGAVVP